VTTSTETGGGGLHWGNTSMPMERRRFLKSATALGLLGAAPPSLAATRSGDALDAVLAEIARAPQRLRSSSLLFRETDAALPDLSFEASLQAADEARAQIARLTPLRSADLDGDRRDTLEAVIWDLEGGVESQRYYWLDSPLSADGSALSIATGRLAAAPLRTAAARDNYLSMLAGFPAYIDQILEKVRGQQSRNIIAHRETVTAVLLQMDTLLASPTATFIPAPARLAHLPEPEAARFTAQAGRLLADGIMPRLRRLGAYLRDDYLPGTGETVGLWRQPDGDDFYRFLIRFNVTLDIDPEDAHRRALDTVAEAERDMAELRRRIGFNGSAEAFHHTLETDARWKSTTTQEVAARFEAGLAGFDPHFSRFFETRPTTPYSAAPQPPEYNDIMVNGRYQWPTDEDPQGTYLFNGGDLDTTTWFWSTPLIHHELVPGHHLQFDRVRDSRTLPPFRKSLVMSGHTEGWAEYGRSLVVEAGVYDDDPMARYADRLMDRRMAMMTVADTGMHARRWSLDEAVSYFSTNAITIPSLQRRAMLGIATEYPGFLLCYWAGGAEFARLRRATAARAGPGFDLRRFHEVILSGGVLSFPVLEARLNRHFPGVA